MIGGISLNVVCGESSIFPLTSVGLVPAISRIDKSAFTSTKYRLNRPTYEFHNSTVHTLHLAADEQDESKDNLRRHGHVFTIITEASAFRVRIFTFLAAGRDG